LPTALCDAQERGELRKRRKKIVREEKKNRKGKEKEMGQDRDAERARLLGCCATVGSSDMRA
jgi:hypothetical protein